MIELIIMAAVIALLHGAVLYGAAGDASGIGTAVLVVYLYPVIAVMNFVLLFRAIGMTKRHKSSRYFWIGFSVCVISFAAFLLPH